MGSSIGYFEIAQEPGSNFIPRIFTELTQENVKLRKSNSRFYSFLQLQPEMERNQLQKPA